MFPARCIALAVAIGTVLVVGGCANGPGDYEVVTRVSEEQSMLRFNAAPFKDATIERAAYYDVWQYEEFARVGTGDFLLEAIYVKPDGDNTAVEYPYSLNAMAATWRHNAGRAMVWGSDARVPSPITDLWFRRFTLSDRNESCAAFDAEWDPHPHDFSALPTGLIFGFLCGRPGKQLSDATIDAVLSGIGIRGVTERIRAGEPGRLAMNFGHPVVTPPRERTAALAVAHGADAAGTGNPGFPFRLVRVIGTTEDSEGNVN